MLKKASFTVEAACIVPLMLTFIAFLLGFTYFTHHMNWCKGASYESIYYALQRQTEEADRSDIAAGRLGDRILEIPLEVSEISSDVSSGAGSLKAGTGTAILPDVFGDLFTLKTEVSAAEIDPAKIKKAEWILRYSAALFGS